MRSIYAGGVLVAALLGLAACGEPQQPPTQITVTSPPPSALLTVTTTPPPPPQAQVEMIPPSPGGGAVWQPGQWRWTGMPGSDWQWVSGHYVVPPTMTVHWVPGQWVQQPGGGWMWLDGHWA